MDIVRKQMSYKCCGIESSKICNSDFTRMQRSVQTIHLQVDNVVALSYLVKMGSTDNKVLSNNKQRDLGLLAGYRHHNYSRISSRCSKKRKPISSREQERLNQREVGSQSFSNNMRQKGASRISRFRSQHTYHGSWTHSARQGTFFN